MGRRTLLLLAALVVAALGTTGVFLYVDGVEQRAAVGLDQVELLVASEAIQAGTTAGEAEDAGSLDLRNFTTKSVDGLPYVSDVAGFEDRAAIAPIAAGSPILAGQFGEQAEGSVLPIPEGEIAIAVELSDPARVAGFVVPGSRVAVFLTSDDGTGATTRLLLEDAPVLASGAATLGSGIESAQPDEDIPTALLTLALDQVEAQKVIYGSTAGTLHLGLRREDSELQTTDNGTTEQNLFD